MAGMSECYIIQLHLFRDNYVFEEESRCVGCPLTHVPLLHNDKQLLRGREAGGGHSRVKTVVALR